jgi:tetratricopeptide (TPR) repeat protein
LFADTLEKFETLIAEEKYDDAKTALDEWAEDKQDDPRYYFSYFNYYLLRSESSIPTLTSDSNETDNSLVLTDPDNGEPVGYMGNVVQYDPAYIQTAIDIVNDGITKFPDNFNMRFGLLYADLLGSRLDDYLNDFDKILSYFSKADKSNIYWFYEQKLENPEEYLIEHIQENFYYITGDQELLKNTEFLNRYCDLVIQYFPEHKYGYSNKGVIASMNGDNNKAIESFLTAYSKDENDILIAFNIGFVYKQTRKLDEAKKYFNRVIEIGNDEYYVEGAKQLLKEME